MRFCPVLVLVAFAACGEADDRPSTTGPGDGHLLPDFTLLDVNANSPTFDAEVSPRQFLTKVSAWYFGHST
jgi:hypothetical protein